MKSIGPIRFVSLVMPDLSVRQRSDGALTDTPTIADNETRNVTSSGTNREYQLVYTHSRTSERLRCSQDIWDTAGQEVLKGLRAAAYPESDLILFAFNMSDGGVSLGNIEQWVNEADEHASGCKARILLGTQVMD